MTYYYEIAPLIIVREGSSVFTYSFDSRLPIGKIVKIEVGSKNVIGVVYEEVAKPNFKTKVITGLVEQKPIPVQLIHLANWISEYYSSPLANVLSTILPSGIEKKRREPKEIDNKVKRKRTNYLLNSGQSRVVSEIDKNNHGTYLLHGITGSGKTAVYIELAKKSINNGKSVIILVPEIALTPQIVAEFSNHFNNIILYHSKMTEYSRHNAWKEALNQEKPFVAIGPRSALFTPFSNLGLVIIDEAHEPSYKQEQSPRYSAIRAASILCDYHKAILLIGSATPSVIDSYLAIQSNKPVLKLSNKAVKNTVEPTIKVVDMKIRANFNHRFISKQLETSIRNTLLNKKQVLIFHNRRGSANITVCNECGWSSECPRCFIPLTLHVDRHRLECHICGHSTPVLTSCPECHKTGIVHKGIGTKLIESEFTRLFPEAIIARFDADNKIGESIDNRYGELYSGAIDIAIGTQVLAKGLDLPHLRTVGVIQADTGLALPDFSTNERTFQLLYQVIGRVGRNEFPTDVIVQTYQPSHSSIIYGINQDYESFYDHTLSERKKANFPPFVYLAKAVCSYKTEQAAIKNSSEIAKKIKTEYTNKVQVLGPTPAFYERQNGNYRWQIVLKSKKRQYIQQALKLVPKQHWQQELDPTSLL